ncbi:MAG TPA: aminotransferase class I/II-fold pyridoxal phosphate-dependent enzyme, partial [Caballeronia sp.]|nr:aminotransferase class I/II-fold pyridoxal phosphate-dependent enzyme [Caballeronia sp.]
MSSSRVAARVQRIKTSPSSAAADRAAELRRQGRTIVNLAIGEPDFPTPAHIRRAAADAMERGETRYTQTAGSLALRTAIAAKLREENGLGYEPKQVIVTCGAKHAIFNALAVTVEPEDEVLIPAPYWVSYPDMVLACEGKPVVLPCAEADGFKLTAQTLEAAITARTRWLILNSPNNPTGASYSATELRALADVLVRHPHVLILTDDIYEHIRFDDQANPHIVAIEQSLSERTIVVNGMSKTYAMTGWRIGYAAGPADLIAAMDTLQSQSTSCASSVSQAAALAALEGDQSSLAEALAIYRARRDRGLDLLNAITGLSCRTPGGAFYLFVNCGGLIGKQTPGGKRIAGDMDVVAYFLEAAGVVLVAGS